jgi:hypothetical protein
VTVEGFKALVTIGFGVRLNKKQAGEVAASITELEARLSEAREVLREVEWEGQNMGRASCPSCGGLQTYKPPFKHEFILKDETPGHAPACRLARLLAPPPEATP